MQFTINNIRPEFYEALNDYSILLEKKYPQKAILKLIGDRYKLSGIERTILYRGIFCSQENKNRQQKLSADVGCNEIYIDTYNILITIVSYLNGNVLFIGTDNLLRDASEIHGKGFRSDLLNRSVELLFHYLSQKEIQKVNFYIDSPVSHSAKLKIILENEMLRFKINGNVKLLKSPDFHLKNITEGFVATSDSVIIDKSKTHIIDLAYLVLMHHFNPKFVIIDKILSKNS